MHSRADSLSWITVIGRLFTVLCIVFLVILALTLLPGNCKKLEVYGFWITTSTSPVPLWIPVGGLFTVNSDGANVRPQFQFMPWGCREPVNQKSYRWYLDGNLNAEWNNFEPIPLYPRELSPGSEHILLLEIRAKDMIAVGPLRVSK